MLKIKKAKPINKGIQSIVANTDYSLLGMLGTTLLNEIQDSINIEVKKEAIKIPAKPLRLAAVEPI